MAELIDPEEYSNRLRSAWTSCMKALDQIRDHTAEILWSFADILDPENEHPEENHE